MNNVAKTVAEPQRVTPGPANVPPSSSLPQHPTEEPVAGPSQAPESKDSWSTLWLTDRDIAVFTMLAFVVLALLGVRWAQLSGWGRHEIEIERLTPIEYSYRLDLNTATWVEFAQLEGVGETLAMRIVEDRATNGPFQSVDELDRVKGIGPKTLERLRPYLKAESIEARE